MVELITEKSETKTFGFLIPGHSKVGALLDASTALDFYGKLFISF